MPPNGDLYRRSWQLSDIWTMHVCVCSLRCVFWAISSSYIIQCSHRGVCVCVFVCARTRVPSITTNSSTDLDIWPRTSWLLYIPDYNVAAVLLVTCRRNVRHRSHACCRRGGKMFFSLFFCSSFSSRQCKQTAAHTVVVGNKNQENSVDAEDLKSEKFVVVWAAKAWEGKTVLMGKV